MKPRIPRRLLLELTLSMLRGQRRSSLADASRMVAALPKPPRLLGREWVPASGRCMVVANHYQRRDLWIGWAGSLLMHAAGRPIHWLVLREFRLGPFEVPMTRRLFQAVAATYDFLPLPADPLDRMGQAAGARQAVRVVQRGGMAGFFPEGEHGHAGGLSPPLPGAPALACLLSHVAPLLPAAVWEEDGRMTAAFGPPYRLERPDSAALMTPVARLLPLHLRGPYGP